MNPIALRRFSVHRFPLPLLLVCVLFALQRRFSSPRLANGFGERAERGRIGERDRRTDSGQSNRTVTVYRRRKRGASPRSERFCSVRRWWPRSPESGRNTFCRILDPTTATEKSTCRMVSVSLCVYPFHYPNSWPAAVRSFIFYHLRRCAPHKIMHVRARNLLERVSMCVTTVRGARFGARARESRRALVHVIGRSVRERTCVCE